MCDSLDDMSAERRVPGQHLAARIQAISLLDDPVRRRVYFLVASGAPNVDRDTVASELDISRSLAAFHLDKLAEEGLLEVSHKRVSGRVGRGAGRPRKLYRKSNEDVAVDIPQRDYELMADLFATVLESAGPGSKHRLARTAKESGVGWGRAARAAVQPRPSQRRLLEGALEALVSHGYDPFLEGSDICMRNCPFHALYHEHRELVCHANHALMTGLVDGLEADGLQAVSAPAEGRCCVLLRGTAEGYRRTLHAMA